MYLDQLPARTQFIAEYTGQQMDIVALPDGTKYQWDLPTSALQSPGAMTRSHRVAWAPLNRQFVFASYSSATLVSMAGIATPLNLQMPGELRPLEGMETYSISPDGRFLAYYLLTQDRDEPQPDGRARPYQDLMIQDTRGSPPISLLRGTRPLAIAWSPDASRIVLATGEGKLLVLDLSGKILQTISVRSGNKNGAGESFDPIDDVQWQPNGELIALIDNFEIYVVNSDGSDFHKVPVNPTPISVASFSWSPDGKRLAFRSVTSRSCHFTFNTSSFRQCTVDTALFVSNADGKDAKKVPGSDRGNDQASDNPMFWLIRE